MGRILIFLSLLVTSEAQACLNIFAVDSAGKVRLLEHEFFFAV